MNKMVLHIEKKSVTDTNKTIPQMMYNQYSTSFRATKTM